VSITATLLASLNAILNTTSAACAFLGWRAIRRKEVARHKRFMTAAFIASCLFLVSYLTRIVLFGDMRFQGEGAIRIVYFGVLVSHVSLALLTAPLVVTALALALSGRIAAHRKVARATWPIWMYVSVTGVLVYLFLYSGVW
jgi:putative membrane protein